MGVGDEIADVTSHSIVAKRYRVERAIGRGAMGEVLEVEDLSSGRRLALKRPRPAEVPVTTSLSPSASSLRPSKRPQSPAMNDEHLANLIRREYVILSQLAHPGVVAVYDCGVDEGKPFYTMELLCGQHPGTSDRMAWRDACRMLTSLCEPLALLHSRRLVHRDISPRNVFVEPGGTAKLIDFGAMASMGAHHRPVGTPSTMAPEVWHREQLDGRADIFGLGALAYCALTGRHAYPARTLPQLPIIWQTSPPPPSELVPDVPQGLNALLVSMLSLERDGRPQSISEVLQRLRALGEFGAEEVWVAPPQALFAPLLVGRQAQADSIRGFVQRTVSGRGLTCAVRGTSGSGRTRLLDTIAERAQEAGARAVHASAGLLEDEPFALLRELAQALALIGPEPRRLTLSPELEPALEILCSDEPIDLRNEAGVLAVQNAFVQFCEQCAEHRPLCLAIDDVERADSHSIRALAQLARRASKQRLLVALVTDTDRPAGGTPLANLLRSAVRLECPPLHASDVEALAGSVFGDVPNLARVGRWAYRHSAGHVGTCFALFQMLVTAGAAQFAAGSWQLPEDPDALSPRDGLDLALQGAEAGRGLLELLALATRPLPLELSAYVSALPGEAGLALDDLVRAQLVLATGQGYAMRDYGALRSVEAQLGSSRRSELHRTLAELYRRHGDAYSVQVAFHLWHAGDREEADAVMRRVQATFEHGLRDLIWRPGGLKVPATFLEELLAYRKERGDSPTNLYAVRGALLALALVSDVDMVRYAGETLDQLSYDVGLDAWDRTDPNLPSRARTVACIQLARARREATPEAERGLAPERAVVELTRCISLLGSPCAFTYDVELTRKLSMLVEPLRELSADGRVIADSTQLSFTSLVLGDRAIGLRRSLLEATTPENGGDLHPILRDGMHHLTAYYLALELAAEGNDEALDHARLLEAHPLYEVLAMQIRRTHALGCGQYAEAQRWRRRRELQALRTERSDNHLHLALLREVQSAFRCWDLLELSRCMSQLEDFARRFPGWKPWASWTRAAFHARAEEPEVARVVLESALAELAPFSHGAWHVLTVSLAEVQATLGDYATAQRLVASVTEGAAGLGIDPDSLMQAHSVQVIARAATGDPRGAMERQQMLLMDAQLQHGPRSLRVGMLYEVGCHIAWLARDYNAFSSQVASLAAYYANHPGLRAQHTRWIRKGQERFRKLLAVLEKTNTARDWASRLSQTATTQGGGDDAASNLLAFVLDELQVESGQLYRVGAQGNIQLLASRPDMEEPALVAAAARSLEGWFSADDAQTADDASESSVILDSQGHAYVPLWLTKPTGKNELSGLVLASCSAEQLATLSPAFVKAVAMHLESLA